MDRLQELATYAINSAADNEETHVPNTAAHNEETHVPNTVADNEVHKWDVKRVEWGEYNSGILIRKRATQENSLLYQLDPEQLYKCVVSEGNHDIDWASSVSMGSFLGSQTRAREIGNVILEHTPRYPLTLKTWVQDVDLVLCEFVGWSINGDRDIPQNP